MACGAGSVGARDLHATFRAVRARALTSVSVLPLDRAMQCRRFCGSKPGAEYRVRAVAGAERQPVLAGCTGGRREERGSRCVPGPGSGPLRASGGRALRRCASSRRKSVLGAEQSRMDWEHPVRYTIAAKKEARPHLIDRRAEDGRLGGCAGPLRLEGGATTASGRTQGAGHLVRHGREGAPLLAATAGWTSVRAVSPRSIRSACARGVVDDESPIDDAHDPKRMRRNRKRGGKTAASSAAVLPAPVGMSSTSGHPLPPTSLSTSLVCHGNGPVAVDGVEERAELARLEGHAMPLSHRTAKAEPDVAAGPDEDRPGDGLREFDDGVG